MQLEISYVGLVTAVATCCVGRGSEPGDTMTVLRGHDDCVTSIAFSPEGTTLASTGRDGFIRFWDTENGGERLSIADDSDREYNPVNEAAFSPDGKLLLTCSGFGRHMRLRDASTGEIRREWPVVNDEVLWNSNLHGVTYSADFHPKGYLIACGGVSREGGHVFLVDTRAHKIPEKLTGHRGEVFAVRFSADGSMLASAGRDDRIVVWDVISRKIQQVLEQKGAIWSLDWAPEGKRLACGGTKGIIRIWDLAEGNQRTQKEIPAYDSGRLGGEVSELCFFPRSSRLAVVGTEFRRVPHGKAWLSMPSAVVRVFNTSSGDKLAEMVKPHVVFSCVAVSPDGETVAIGADQKIILWRPRQTGPQASPFGTEGC